MSDQTSNPEYRKAVANSMRRRAERLLEDALALDPDAICADPPPSPPGYDREMAELLVKLRDSLRRGESEADDSRRGSVLEFLFAGICLSCHRVVGDQTCHCENDE